jgi:hypothetical protein
MPEDRPYKVGFGKPPRNNQFKKGASGNPNGRPKGRKNLATVLERELQQKVVINENGQRKTITKLEAAIKQVVNKAAGGDLVALKQLHALVRSSEEGGVEEPQQEQEFLRENDEKVMKNILRRFERTVKGGSDAAKHE